MAKSTKNVREVKPTPDLVQLAKEEGHEEVDYFSMGLCPHGHGMGDCEECVGGYDGHDSTVWD